MGRFSPPLAYWYLRQKQLGYPGAGGGIGAGGGTYTPGPDPVFPDTTPPTITSSGSFTQAENSAFSTTLTANETVTWAKIGGADAGLFTLSGSTLSLPAKDYELPGDTDGNNVYLVQVRATDTAGNQTEQTISVTITDVADSAGTAPADFALSPSSTADDASVGSTVGALSTTGTTTRPNDFTLTGTTTADNAAIGSTVGTLG